jgi:hypothetical protein
MTNLKLNWEISTRALLDFVIKCCSSKDEDFTFTYAAGMDCKLQAHENQVKFEINLPLDAFQKVESLFFTWSIDC